MSFNIWHYIVILVVLVIYAGGIVFSLKQGSRKLIAGMIFTVTLISIFLAFMSIMFVEKYTKHASAFKVQNKRLLSIEKIVYTGFVKNDGDYTIGEVTFEVKLVNKGHETGGNIKGGTFYQASGFMNFFTGGANVLFRPQSVTKEFVVARDLEPGNAQQFRVYFDYPPYFKSVSSITKVYAH